MAEGFRGDLVARNTLVPSSKAAMESVLNSAKTKAPVGDKPRDGKNPIHMKDTIRLDARIPSEKDKRSDYVNETDSAIAVVSVKRVPYHLQMSLAHQGWGPTLSCVLRCKKTLRQCLLN